MAFERCRAWEAQRFSAENGGRLLATAFATVHTIELHNSSLMVTDARAVTAEAARLRYGMEPHLASGTTWDTFLTEGR